MLEQHIQNITSHRKNDIGLQCLWKLVSLDFQEPIWIVGYSREKENTEVLKKNKIYILQSRKK